MGDEKFSVSNVRAVVEWFAGHMERKLRQNDHKDGWDDCTLMWLMGRLRGEVEELTHALTDRVVAAKMAGDDELTDDDMMTVIGECADVANFSMMVASRAAGYSGELPVNDRVIVESPYRGSTQEEQLENIKYACLCMRDCLMNHGESPLASHLLYAQTGVLDDDDPSQREMGIEAGFSWGSVSRRTVVYVDRGPSWGMVAGIRNALKAGREVRCRTLEHVDILASGRFASFVSVPMIRDNFRVVGSFLKLREGR